MKYCILLFLLSTIVTEGFCQTNPSVNHYTIPDSINAIGFYAEFKIGKKNKVQGQIPSISVNGANLGFSYDLKYQKIEFSFSDKKSKAVVSGKDVQFSKKKNSYTWNYPWNYNESYPLLILTASDSASNSTIYSGYIYFTSEKKWKLIATRSYEDTVRVKTIYPENNTSETHGVTYSNRWLIRSNGTWKSLDSQATKSPTLRPMSNIDSAAQNKIEVDLLVAKLPKDSITFKDGIFYQPLIHGSGTQVVLTDTVVVHYKGWLFGNGQIFDQTKEKPATFPLNRLIKGWQTGLTECRVGGKIRLYIPSGGAYGIRTITPNIPPNSILVFDVEVLEVKAKVEN